MPQRNTSGIGARGIKGHEAVARQMDALGEYIATPTTARRGCSPACTTSAAPTAPAQAPGTPA
ncbi:hypothetical protein ABZV29_41815 [Streptomyces sp. NPDC005236]|uniref:hypothetical protein n=1 Tax=Streptomyces sp. NPDC005236 TaxID=3157028 RepID=UPI00339FC654